VSSRGTDATISLPGLERAAAGRPRLRFERWPAAVYAVGDVHGCLDQLRALERDIVADAEGIAGEKWIVMLGDYIDRGPASPAVLDHVAAPPPAGFTRFTLAGNHEQALLNFLDDPPAHLRWLAYGGVETALAYGVSASAAAHCQKDPASFAATLASLLPARHLDLLRALPICLALPGFFFVHAGIRPGIAIEDQTDTDLLWIRQPFTDTRLDSEVTVVHGHTPVDTVKFGPGRINIDTGCVFNGVLTALRVTPDGALKVLQATGAPGSFAPPG
jgi:serine/threonine protein phosphatase 1